MRKRAYDHLQKLRLKLPLLMTTCYITRHCQEYPVRVGGRKEERGCRRRIEEV